MMHGTTVKKVKHEFDISTTVDLNNLRGDVVSTGKFYIPEKSVLQQLQKL